MRVNRGFTRRCGRSYVEKVKLFGSASDGLGEEKHISLQPSHLGGGILETDARTRHCELQRTITTGMDENRIRNQLGLGTGDINDGGAQKTSQQQLIAGVGMTKSTETVCRGSSSVRDTRRTPGSDQPNPLAGAS